MSNNRSQKRLIILVVICAVLVVAYYRKIRLYEKKIDHLCEIFEEIVKQKDRMYWSYVMSHEIRERYGYVDSMAVWRMVAAVDRYWERFDLGGIDKLDVYALYIVETQFFNTRAIGPTNEKGIAQLMPETIEALRKKLDMPDLDPYIVEDSVLMTLAWLEEKNHRYGNRDDTLTAYNGYVVRKNKVVRRYLKKLDREKARLVKIFRKGSG